jgi:hypothetical protein
VLVSKLKPPSDILAAHEECGHEHFGENYIQELQDKAEKVRRGHLITVPLMVSAASLLDQMALHRYAAPLLQGAHQADRPSRRLAAEQQVQSARVCVDRLYDVFHSQRRAAIPNLYALETLDTEKKADLLEKTLAADDRRLRVYLQLNTSGEDSKAGCASAADLAALAKHVRSSCPHLDVVGLMTIGSYEASQDNDASNPDFEALVKARDELGEGNLELSMGMSADFAKAIAMGSDNVRVGSRAFGERPSKADAKAQRATEQGSS